jgi:hypothetical protein
LPSQEARAVLAGHTVSGHPVSEARELLNYRAGTAWIIEQTTPPGFFGGVVKSLAPNSTSIAAFVTMLPLVPILKPAT